MDDYRSVLGRLGLGRVAYALYHAPAAKLRRSLAAGGPLEQWRTARGHRAMRQAAISLPLLPPSPGGSALELHVLTGRGFWDQTAFCLWTFAQQSGRALRPVIYDDGSLRAEHREPIARLFPASRFVARTETEARLDAHLPVARFPHLRERWLHYPNLRKLTEPHLAARGWKLVLDSDLLFFRAPEFVTAWLDAPDRPLHAVDNITSYGYSRPLLESLAGAPLAERVNVGLCGLDSYSLDWERIESWCRTLIEREGTHYFLEQALVAMLVAGRPCAVAPENDYVTLPPPPEAEACRAVMHHYVAGSKHWYFRRNWRVAVSRLRAP